MSNAFTFHRIAAIGSYLPRQCGIATFTSDLCEAMAVHLPDGHIDVIAMDDLPEGYNYPERVKFQIQANVQKDYLRAAEFLNVSQYDAVIVQFEYGIFGGKDGAHLIRLLRSLRMPVITTLHTTLAEPSEGQRNVLMGLADVSEKVVLISRKSEEIVRNVYGLPPERIAFLPHGIPDVPFSDPAYYKDVFSVERNRVILTFGLINPGKGIEYMIDAMPAILSDFPDAVYIVLGATHPVVKRQSGEAYRQSLYKRVSALGLEDSVFFHDRFVGLDDLCQYIGAADVYVTPYLNREQISSGTLAYALGAGKAVVSTPYWYAEELLQADRGVIVPFRDSRALAASVCGLFGDPVLANALRKRAYLYCRNMVWKQVGEDYLKLVAEASDERMKSPKARMRRLRMYSVSEELPEMNFSHLQTLTDDTGLIKHAIFTVPDRHSGYTVDDNSRAMAALSLAFQTTRDREILPLLNTYLSFVNYAFDREKRIFRNTLSYDRRWAPDEPVSQDAQGRVLWGLGEVIRNLPPEGSRDLAFRLFNEAMSVIDSLIHPRSIAFAIVGIDAFLEIYPGNTDARRARALLLDRLLDLYGAHAKPDWPWCDEKVSYANAKIPQAMILSGKWVPHYEALEIGLHSLEWLLEMQLNDKGQLSLLGGGSWEQEGGGQRCFAQLPLDAMNLVGACATAYNATQETKWLERTRCCFRWFLGFNDLNAAMVDFKTGGCFDALEAHGPSANQGAEATVSWLIALSTMHQINSLTNATVTSGNGVRTIERTAEVS